MTLHKCEYCKKDFYGKSAINRHLKTASFCIEIRRQQGINTEQTFIKCENCDKQFTIKSSLTEHLSVCKNKNVQNITENKVEKTEKSTISLESYLYVDSLKEIFKHTNLSGYLELTPSSIIDKIIHLLNGKNQPIYYCSDRSRQRFFYFGETGEVEDKQAIILRTLLYNGLFPVFHTIHIKRLFDIELNISKYKRMPGDGDSLLSSWRDDHKNLLDHYEKLNMVTNHRDYLIALSKKLPTKPDQNKTI